MDQAELEPESPALRGLPQIARQQGRDLRLIDHADPLDPWQDLGEPIKQPIGVRLPHQEAGRIGLQVVAARIGDEREEGRNVADFAANQPGRAQTGPEDQIGALGPRPAHRLRRVPLAIQVDDAHVGAKARAETVQEFVVGERVARDQSHDVEVTRVRQAELHHPGAARLQGHGVVGDRLEPREVRRDRVDMMRVDRREAEPAGRIAQGAGRRDPCAGEHHAGFGKGLAVRVDHRARHGGGGFGPQRRLARPRRGQQKRQKRHACGSAGYVHRNLPGGRRVRPTHGWTETRVDSRFPWDPYRSLRRRSSTSGAARDRERRY